MSQFTPPGTTQGPWTWDRHDKHCRIWGRVEDTGFPYLVAMKVDAQDAKLIQKAPELSDKLDEAVTLLLQVHAITTDIWCDEMSDLNFRHLQDCLAEHARKLAKMSRKMEELFQSIQHLKERPNP